MKKIVITIAKIMAVLAGFALVFFTAGVLWPLDLPQPGERPRQLLLANLSLVDVQRYRDEVHSQGYHLRSDCGLVLRTQSIFQVKEE